MKEEELIRIIRENPKKIKLLRGFLFLFKKEVAKICKVRPETVANWEHGTVPRKENIIPLIRLFLKKSENKTLDEIREIAEKNLKELEKLRLSGFGKKNKKSWKAIGNLHGPKGAEVAPLTTQEKELLSQLKNFRCIEKIESHVTLFRESLSPINIDIKIKLKDGREFFVTLKRVKTKDKKNLLTHASFLALEGFRIRKRVKKSKNISIFCIFEAPKFPTKVVTFLSEAFDEWFKSVDDFVRFFRKRVICLERAAVTGKLILPSR